MKTQVTVDTQVTTFTTFYRGNFIVAPEKVSYGQGGLRVPYAYSLTVNEIKKVNNRNSVSYVLVLDAKNSNRNATFHATYSYPNKTSLSQEVYGYGAAEHLADAPISILKAIQIATKVPLLTLVNK